MITKLFEKQLQAELGIIRLHLYAFVKHFFGDEEAEKAKDESITYFFSFDLQLYVQKFWVDSQGKNKVQEQTVDFEKYNEWCKEVCI